MFLYKSLILWGLGLQCGVGRFRKLPDLSYMRGRLETGTAVPCSYKNLGDIKSPLHTLRRGAETWRCAVTPRKSRVLRFKGGPGRRAVAAIAMRGVCRRGDSGAVRGRLCRRISLSS